MAIADCVTCNKHLLIDFFFHLNIPSTDPQAPQLYPSLKPFLIFFLNAPFIKETRKAQHSTYVGSFATVICYIQLYILIN